MARRLKLSLRPSASKRWTTCLGSPGLEAQLKAKGKLPDGGSKYADEGTAAHEMAAEQFVMGWDEEGLKSHPDQSMVKFVKGYYDFVMDKVETYKKAGDYTFWVEEPLQLFYLKETDEPGTADTVLAQADGSRVYFADLKYGAGVSVEAKNNTQIAIYVESFMRQYEVLYPFTDKTLITIAIYQPRIADERPVRLWVLSRKELRDFCKEHVQVKVDFIERNPDNNKFAPSDETCQFCKCQALCPARAAYLLGELPLEPVELLTPAPTSELVLPSPDALTEEQLGRVVAVRPHLVKWLQDCHDHVLLRLGDGHDFPGYKLVAGKSNRQWKDPVEAEKWLRKIVGEKATVVHEPELVSPTQAEKILKELEVSEAVMTSFKRHVVKPKGGPSLAPSSDKRPAITLQADPKEEFEREMTDEEKSLL